MRDNGRQSDANLGHKLAIVVSHPIQHFASFYRALAETNGIELRVFFCAKIGTKPYFDKAMNTEITWNTDLLGGYDHVFLPEADTIENSAPLSVNNPSVSLHLREFEPDAVLIYGYSNVTSNRALYWCRTNNVPAIFISDSELRGIRSKKVRFVKRLILPLLFKQYSAFLTVGDCNDDYYAHYGVDRKKLFRSPFTIDEKLYRNTRKNRKKIGDALREEMGIPSSQHVGLFVGKLSERKRPMDLVNTAKILVKKNKTDVSFLVAGNGSEYEAMKSEIQKHDLPLTMAGFVNVDKLPQYYAASDFLIHPSSHDPHPLTCSESACVGLPVLVSDRVGAAGPTDIARPGENAMIFPVGNCEQIAERILQITESPDLLSSMSSRSLEIFDELDISRSVKGMLDAIEYAMDDRRTKN